MSAPDEPRLTHLDEHGRAHMVDVGHKPVVRRRAVAVGFVTAAPATVAAMAEGVVPKGDVGAVARVAGIMAAKRTSEIVPLCHPLPLDRVAVDVEPQPDRGRVAITATAETSARTGVEMEALTAVVAAALSVYDMLKGIDRGLAIEGVAVVEKRKDDPRPDAQG